MRLRKLLSQPFAFISLKFRDLWEEWKKKDLQTTISIPIKLQVRSALVLLIFPGMHWYTGVHWYMHSSSCRDISQ